MRMHMYICIVNLAINLSTVSVCEIGLFIVKVYFNIH